jgi:site-specific recombinase XerD
MFEDYIPLARRDDYRVSPHKDRMDLLVQHLIRQRYGRGAITQHAREWLRFSSYLVAHQLALPPRTGDPDVQAYLMQRLARCGSASRARVIRASLRMLLEADAQGHFRRRVSTRAMHVVSRWMQAAIDGYLTFLQSHRGLAVRTLEKRASQLMQFAQSVDAMGLTSVAAISPVHLQHFMAHCAQPAVATRRTYAVTLRSFVRWAYGAGLTPVDLRGAVISPRRYRQAGVRDCLTERDITRILAAVDRSTPTGRRDYAVLVLAARYGLRPSDIRGLSLAALDWRHGVLSIQQAKTGRTLVLPLVPDVVEALTAYLRHGRPATTSRFVFVRHRAPFEPFVPTNNLAAIMRDALRRVGMAERTGRRGLYLFRHTLASQMLAAGCAIKIIGDVLGHASTETTMEYATVDLTALRRVALSEAEVRA